jgi:hypothetical protein
MENGVGDHDLYLRFDRFAKNGRIRLNTLEAAVDIFNRYQNEGCRCREGITAC